MKSTVSGIIGLLIVVMSLGCLTPTPSKTEYATQPTTLPQTTTLQSDATLLKIAAANSEVGQFLSENPSYEYKITALKPENITALAGKYPVVYGGLPEKTLYRIDYSYGNRGLLVIVDADEGTVIKYFRAVGINLT